MRKLLIPALLLALSAPARATVPTTSTVAGPFTCNGATAFPVTFRVLDATHLLVERTAADGTVTPLARGVDYSVALSSTGATVTLTSSSRCSTGYTLTITRQVPLTQPTTLSAQGPFNPKVLEAGLDRVTSIAQELSREDGKVRDDFNALQAWVNGLANGNAVVFPKSWVLTGDGTATTFALAGNDISDARSYLVTVDGISQLPAVDFSVSVVAHAVTFTAAPPYGAVVEVRCLTYAKASPAVLDGSTVTATGTSTARSLADRFADRLNAKDFVGVDPTGASNSTLGLQTFLDAVPAGGAGVISSGVYQTRGTLTQKPDTRIYVEGYIQPNAGAWSGASVWVVYDNSSNPWAAGQGQYDHNDRTGVYGLKIVPTGDLDAACVRVTAGLGVVVEDVRTWGCKSGGIILAAGSETRVRNVKLSAPKTAAAGTAGLLMQTHDSSVAGIAVQGYPVGVKIASGYTSNVVTDAHVWGQPRENAVGWMMNVGFWIDGDSNTCTGCYADTPERIVAGTPASAANGGVGFYLHGWNNTLAAPHVIGSVSLSKAFVIEDAANNSIIGGIAPYDATRIEASGYVVFLGTATELNNHVAGGSLATAQPLKARLWHDTNGNALVGAGAVSPGWDSGVGVALYQDGSIGGTRNGPLAVWNRITTPGMIAAFSYNAASIGNIGTNAAGTKLLLDLGGFSIQGGNNTPEGAVTAPVGSIFLRTDGGATTTLYVKTSGAGNTGWTAK